MDSIVLLQGLAGFVLLVLGAEFMVRGAASMAMLLGISPLIVGLTVVAFGTSAPELAIAVKSSLDGQADIALGNVVGSNILNILLILGMSAMITPLVVDSQIIQREVPILLVVSLVLFGAALNGTLSIIEGAVLFGGSIVYTMFAIFSARAANRDTSKDDLETEKPTHPTVSFLLVILGLGMLVIGADFLVDTAVVLATWFGVSELLIGLTIVSIGTSLPEIATSVMAALKGMRDMAVGNVIGSCLFNVMAVGGAAALFSTDGLNVAHALIRFDLPVMLAATLACLPIFATDHLIARWEGLLFFAFYIAYTTYLVMVSHSSESVEVMNIAMLSFVLPLTFVTLLLLWLREVRHKRRKQ